MIRLSRYSGFTTKDVDELCQFASRQLDREIEFMGRRDVHLSAHTAKLELLTVSSVEYGGSGLSSRTINTGYSLVRMEVGRLERRLNGHSHLFGPGGGFLETPEREVMTTARTVSGPSLTVTIALPAGLIEREAELLIGEPVRQPLEVAGPLDLRSSTYLGQNIDYLLEELERDYGIFEKFPLLSQQFQRRVVTGLIVQTANNYRRLLGQHFGGPARRHIMKVEEYVEAHLRDPLTVGDMARAAGISVRTLEDCCRRMRGKTPEMMLRSMRLHGAHKRLAKALPEDTVISVAHEYGFTHPGRFSYHYRREFRGESPVETLQRGRRRSMAALAMVARAPA